jgi:hypothetical protein
MLTLANSANRNHNLTALGNPQTSWPSEMKTATDWFCRMFPVQVRVFGSPFLEQQGSDHIGLITSPPLVSNIDCLAACLGGDVRLGHRVVYYLPELQYYYYDPADQMYHATTADKLGNLYRALMARCAAEVKGEGHIANIFYTFRSDSVVKAVVNRSKSLLAASEGYFGVKSANQRVEGPELHQRLAMVFAERLLEPCAGSILTVGQTYALFNRFVQSRNMPAIERRDFKSVMAEVIRDVYDLGVRNDLVNAETQKQQRGWLGLRPARSDALLSP